MANKLFKYPKTFHLNWSPGLTNDDKIIPSINQFINQEIVVTCKFDGENTSMYSDHYHARSLDSKNHPSRNYVKSLWGEVKHNIPEGFRICGENLFAKHSIHYHNLPSYFLVFAIYDENNTCLSWSETLEYAKMLDLLTVPVLYRGIWNEEKVKDCWKENYLDDEQEGYVVRLANSFHYKDHILSTAKFVRKNHVQTSEHWMTETIIKNLLKE